MANLVLTEQQFNFIKEYSILSESLMVEVDFSHLKKTVIRALLSGMAVASIAAAISNSNVPQAQKDELMELIEQNNTFTQQVEAVKECMEYYVKLNGKDVNSIPLSPDALVRACKEYNYDIPLALAQAKAESLFGLGNRAQRTKSVWSIGSYDNGKNAATYSTANDSIIPYIQTMLNDYLPGKSVEEILQPGNMVNQVGKRYASNPNYENIIRSIRNTIIKNYPILQS